MTINISQFDYHLPKDRIANTPASPRDHSQLMVVNRNTQSISDHHFYDLPNFLSNNDVLVLNQTKVFPARIKGHKSTGGKVEILLLKQLSSNTWQVMSKPSLKLGQKITFNSLQAKVIKKEEQTGYSHLQFNYQDQDLISQIFNHGVTPLPPYIENDTQEKIIRKQYQTTYAKHLGSSAAPTAGLHFTKDLLNTIQNQGTKIEYITLHVGSGTFQNLREENIQTKSLHTEQYQIEPNVAQRLNEYKKAGNKIIAVGTTSTRALETATNQKILQSTQNNQLDSTNMFIYPPYRFQFVDAMITNFHLPKSSLLMLVSALVSQPNTHQQFKTFKQSLIGKAYQHAIDNKYRFFSFGDAMFIH